MPPETCFHTDWFFLLAGTGRVMTGVNHCPGSGPNWLWAAMKEGYIEPVKAPNVPKSTWYLQGPAYP